MRSISQFGRFYEDFPLKEGIVRVPLPFSRNRPENHSHNLRKALGEGLGLLGAPFTSLSLISPSLSISLLLPFFLSLSFFLSFSLAYLMDVFVLVNSGERKIIKNYLYFNLFQTWDLAEFWLPAWPVQPDPESRDLCNLQPWTPRWKGGQENHDHQILNISNIIFSKFFYNYFLVVIIIFYFEWKE